MARHVAIEVGREYVMKTPGSPQRHVRVVKPGSSPECTFIQIMHEDGTVGWSGPVATNRLVRAWREPVEEHASATREPVRCPGHASDTDCEDYGPEGTCTACDAAEDKALAMAGEG